MRHRRRIMSTAVAGLAVAASLGAGGAQASNPPTQWQRLDASWGPGATFLNATDSFATPTSGWVSGTVTTANGLQRPTVQRCATTCRMIKLPLAAGEQAMVNSIGGTSDTDVWAVGAISEGISNDATAWHWNGARWRLVNVPSGDVTLTNIVSVSRGEAWAIGDLDYEDGGTSVVYHRVGATWTQISTLDDPVFPGDCTDWFNISWFDVAIVHGKAVLVGNCSGTQTVLKEQGDDRSWTAIESGLPAGVGFHQAAVVAGELWIFGGGSGSPRAIEKYAGGGWHSVPSTGLDDAMLVSDVAGGPAGKAVAVGWSGGVPTTVAQSRTFNGTTWVPMGPDFGSNTGLWGVSIAPGGHTVAAGFDRANPPPTSALILDQAGRL